MTTSSFPVDETVFRSAPCTDDVLLVLALNPDDERWLKRAMNARGVFVTNSDTPGAGYTGPKQRGKLGFPTLYAALSFVEQSVNAFMLHIKGADHQVKMSLDGEQVSVRRDAASGDKLIMRINPGPYLDTTFIVAPIFE